MFKRLLLAAGLSALFSGPAQAAAPPVTYQIRPVLQDGALTALAVEMRLRGEASGQTRLDLPHEPCPSAQDVRDLTVTGASVRADGAARVLSHPPGAPLVVRYRLVSAYDKDPESQPFRPVLRPDWFVVHGSCAFVTPQGRPDAPARLAWRDLPSGWTAASDMAGGARVGDLEERYLIGGKGWVEADQPVGAARLRMFYRPQGWKLAPPLAGPTMAKAVQAGFDYWGDRPRDLFVPVVQLANDADFAGRGVTDGFVIFAGRSVDLRGFLRVFTHEHQHSWISRQIGGFPDTQADLEAWLNEGFTEATTGRVLLHAGLWRLEDFADDLNTSLLNYGASPLREAPNLTIQRDRWRDPAANQLAYDRGRLLALMFERRLRAATGGRVGLKQVLQAQRLADRANRRQGRRVAADALFPKTVRRVAGLDIGGDLARYVERGARIELPSDLFGDCGVLQTLSQPAFDRGFDLMATLRNGGQLTGLEAGGPAARAGLREGVRIAMDEVYSTDSQKPLTYVVREPGGGRRPVTYKPEGQAQVGFQRLRLNPGLDAAGRARCRMAMSGGG